MAVRRCWLAAVLPLLLFALPSFAQAPGGITFQEPPERVLTALRSRYVPGDWLFVTTPAGREVLRAWRIDETGLVAVRAPRGSRPSSPDLDWSRIARIERRTSHAGSGMLLGALVGGLAFGYGFAPLDPSSNMGTWIAMPIGVAAVGWAGRTIGDRHARGETWYVGRPASGEPESAPMSAAPAIGIGADPGRALSRMQRYTGRENVLRVRGTFGEFYGWADQVDRSGLANLRPHPRLDPNSGPIPDPIRWDQITRIDRKGTSGRRFALAGALLLGTPAALFGGAVSAALGHGSNDVAGAAAAGFTIGGMIGAVAGSGIGVNVTQWHRVYSARPVAER